MKANSNRDLLVLLKTEFMSQHAIEQEVESLHGILVRAESFEQFSTAHEFIMRNRITRKTSTLLKVFRQINLKPFQFLLNLN